MSWRPSIQISTERHKEPDTKLTKSEIDAIREDLEDAKYTKLKKIVDTIRSSLINSYFNKELDAIEGGITGKKQNTLSHITSNIHALLDKMTPTGQSGGAKTNGNFRYHSVQLHTFSANGHQKTRKNIVKVNGTKGTKSVHIYDSAKKRKTYKNTKPLTAQEIRNIRRGNRLVLKLRTPYG